MVNIGCFYFSYWLVVIVINKIELLIKLREYLVGKKVIGIFLVNLFNNIMVFKVVFLFIG